MNFNSLKLPYFFSHLRSGIPSSHLESDGHPGQPRGVNEQKRAPPGGRKRAQETQKLLLASRPSTLLQGCTKLGG